MSPRVSGLRALMLALLPVLAVALPASAQQVVTVTTPRGATIKYLALAPARPPAAAVVLLAGGNGLLSLLPHGSIDSPLKNNFLIRSRQLFVDSGLYVAALDVPSDQANGLTMAYRLSLQHAKDIRQVANDVRARANAVVWLVGTSAGTLSAAKAATPMFVLPPTPALVAPKGIVLTSTLTHKTMACPKSVGDVALDKIGGPVLVVSHRDDACACTPSVDADAVYDKLASASAKEVMIFPGGDPPQSAPCQARSPHGYFGIEAKVVAEIAKWIKDHSN